MRRNTDILAALRKELKAHATPEAKASSARFFREEMKCYGVTSPVTGKIAQKFWRALAEADKQEIFALCEALFRSDYSEEAYIAAEWLWNVRGQFEQKDFAVFARWIEQYINTWAKCDTLCNHALAALVEKYPVFLKDLMQWTKSPNRWVRRAAAVTLILPARRGKFLAEVFAIADSLLLDEDDLVQKGYGWLLKEASRIHQTEVFDYIMRHKAVMPRTALRYAIEKMPSSLRSRAMQRA